MCFVSVCDVSRVATRVFFKKKEVARYRRPGVITSRRRVICTPRPTVLPLSLSRPSAVLSSVVVVNFNKKTVKKLNRIFIYDRFTVQELRQVSILGGWVGWAPLRCGSPFSRTYRDRRVREGCWGTIVTHTHTHAQSRAKGPHISRASQRARRQSRSTFGSVRELLEFKNPDSTAAAAAPCFRSAPKKNTHLFSLYPMDDGSLR